VIRKATAGDVPYILELYAAGLGELGFDGIDKERLLAKVISSYHLAPCFLLVIDDKICGMAGLSVNIIPWSGKATLCDYIFYIRPEYRGLSNFGGLVKACKDFSDEVSLPLSFNFTVNDDEDVRKRVFKMHGFETKYITGTYNGSTVGSK